MSPEAEVVILLPPAILRSSSAIVTDTALDESSITVNTPAADVCESTYALIDCCVESAVAEFEDISSSSTMDVIATVFATVNCDPASNGPSTCNPSLITTDDESDDEITLCTAFAVVIVVPVRTSVPLTL